MNKVAYLIFHKDHPLPVKGVCSGAEMATRSMAFALARAGERVVVCGIMPEGEQTYSGVEFWDIGQNFDASSAIVRAERELGYFHLVSAGRAHPLLASQNSKYCVSRMLMCHDPSGSATGISNKILSNLADNVFCVSQAQAQLLIQAGFDSSKVAVIYNGYDRTLFYPGVPGDRDLNKLVFVGALVPHKGAHILIEAYASLKARLPELSLDIFGSADLWGEKPYLNEKEIAQKVSGTTFHGAQPQEVVAKALQRAGICVCPSIWFEALGIASIEAQASGCPAVVFDMGGLPETVLAGQTGIVVREANASALAQAIENIIGDRSRHLEMSRAAAARTAERFSWDTSAELLRSYAQRTLKTSKHSIGSRNILTATGNKNRKSGEINYGRVALLSTWNQECGLATYAKYLFSEFPRYSFLVLAEEVAADKLTARDEGFVRRCWSRQAFDVSKVVRTLTESRSKLLHLNLHDQSFLPFESLLDLVRQVSGLGIRIVSHLHTTFTLDSRLAQFSEYVDALVVHSKENKLQVTAHGIDPEKIWVLPHGIHSVARLGEGERRAIREELGIPEAEKVVLSFGFVQPNKGMEAVIEAVAGLRAEHVASRGYILGKVNDRHPAAAEYRKALGDYAAKLGVGGSITFGDAFLSNEALSRYLQIADLVIMNYQSSYYEASGACSIALGSGALVATSLAPQFSPFADAVWHLTAGFPPAISAKLLLAKDSSAAIAVRKSAEALVKKLSWPRMAQLLQRYYRTKFAFVPQETKELDVDVKTTQTNSAARPRVLFQNRANTFVQRGGDTVVIERFADGLKKLGWDVVIDTDGRENPKNYNLVHLFNFAIPDCTRQFAEAAAAAGTPFVVTTLCEDVPTFHNQSRAFAALLMQYCKNGQDKKWWRQNRLAYREVPASARFNNDWTAGNAAALLSCGAEESSVLRKDYPSARKIVEVPFGCEVVTNPDRTLFEREYGVKDFILCVGRLESRKNQLLLLKALENSELTVVLAAGGFSYQPDYEEAIRNFKRKGRTIVLGRITPEMLASAYACAKAHVLPSWYELPGLVSLEAARYGCNVVVADRGTAYDYLGDQAFYCDPANEHSVYSAVMAAYYAPKVAGLVQTAESYTWDRSVSILSSVYSDVCGVSLSEAEKSHTTTTALRIEAPQAKTEPTSQAPTAEMIERLLVPAENAMRNSKFADARQILDEVADRLKTVARYHRTYGAILFAEGKTNEAFAKFQYAIELDPGDAKSHSGLGMCEISRGNAVGALSMFLKVVDRDPVDGLAMLQIVRCSYMLKRYEELEGALKKYLARKPDDLHMNFCMAGCLLRRGDLRGSKQWLAKVEEKSPTYQGLAELKKEIEKEEAELKGAVSPVIESSPRVSMPPIPSKSEVAGKAQPKSTEKAPELKPTQNIDVQLSELEEQKRERNLAKVREGLAMLPPKAQLSKEQLEWSELLRAEVAVMDGNLDRAQSIYDEVIRENPNSARALCGKGALAAHASKWDEAKRLFNEALRCRPEYDVALAGLGLYSTQAGDRESAWEYYKRALKTNGENVRALLGLLELGYAMKRFGDIEQAIKGYLEMHPADLEFVYALAGCYFTQGKLQETIEAVDKIILFQPQHAKALELRDLVRSKVGGNFAAAAVNEGRI